MQKKIKSLLEELEAIGEKKDKTYLIESRAHNIISSAINLLEQINKYYPKETSEILERKLLGAIKSRDQQRFSKTLKKVSAGKNNENQ